MWHALTWKKYSFLAGSSSRPSTRVRRFACKMSASVSIPWEHKKPFIKSWVKAILSSKITQSSHKLKYKKTSYRILFQNTLTFDEWEDWILWICDFTVSRSAGSSPRHISRIIWGEKTQHVIESVFSQTPHLISVTFLHNNLYACGLRFCSPLLWAPLPAWPSVWWLTPLGRVLWLRRQILLVFHNVPDVAVGQFST